MTEPCWTSLGVRVSVTFSLSAEADPGLLPRLLAPFARRHLVPDRVECHRHGTQMQVLLHLESMPADMVGVVEGNLGQVVGVGHVRVAREVTGYIARRAA